jgi:hypothetical protein
MAKFLTKQKPQKLSASPKQTHISPFLLSSADGNILSSQEILRRNLAAKIRTYDANNLYPNSSSTTSI